MLTHQQNLNVIANNMINVSTAGYKQDRYTASTFDEVMYSRVGNKYNRGEEIGRQSYIRAASDIDTDYTQGTLEPTGLPLDFAINGDGFFAVQLAGPFSLARTRSPAMRRVSSITAARPWPDWASSPLWIWRRWSGTTAACLQAVSLR